MNDQNLPKKPLKVPKTFWDCGFIRIWRGEDDTVVLHCSDGTRILTANEWGSLVATVSRRGEDASTWLEAVEFHTQPEPIDGIRKG